MRYRTVEALQQQFPKGSKHTIHVRCAGRIHTVSVTIGGAVTFHDHARSKDDRAKEWETAALLCKMSGNKPRGCYAVWYNLQHGAGGNLLRFPAALAAYNISSQKRRDRHWQRDRGGDDIRSTLQTLVVNYLRAKLAWWVASGKVRQPPPAAAIDRHSLKQFASMRIGAHGDLVVGRVKPLRWSGGSWVLSLYDTA